MGRYWIAATGSACGTPFDWEMDAKKICKHKKKYRNHAQAAAVGKGKKKARTEP